MNTKPNKPYPEFPLFPHASGQWAKKIKGNLVYFGKWDNPDAALAKYLAGKVDPEPKQKTPGLPKGYPLWLHPNGQWAKKICGDIFYFGTDPTVALNKYLAEREDIIAGRDPRQQLRIKQLIEKFMAAKRKKLASKEIADRTIQDYEDVGDIITEAMTAEKVVARLVAEDFETLRAKLFIGDSPITFANRITRARSFFKYADESLNVRTPYKGMKKPALPVIRIYQQKGVKRLFTNEQIRRMIAEADTFWKAMIYLGINCAFGNNDLATLPIDKIDLDAGFHDYGRPKTGIFRRCPLWPETVAALRAAIEARPTPQDPANENLVFLMPSGLDWRPFSLTDNPISSEFTKLLKRLGIYEKGVGFYSLRHTFVTVGAEAKDRDAVEAIVGHAKPADDMFALYNEKEVDDARLLAVVNYVRKWLKRKQKSV